MCAFRVTISRRHRQELERHLHTAQPVGRWPEVKCLLAILAVPEGQSGDDIARTLRISPKTGHQWRRRVLVEGRHGWQRQKSPNVPQADQRPETRTGPGN